jgi:hypothetical protein
LEKRNASFCGLYPHKNFLSPHKKLLNGGFKKIGSVGVGGFCCFASLLGVDFGGGDKGDF